MSEFDDILGADSDEEPIAADHDVHWNALVVQLEGRCTAAGLPFEKGEIDYGNGDIEAFVSVELPNGKEKRKITFRSKEKIESFLSIPFEKFTFLGDLEAICCYADGVIEAVIRPVQGFQPSRLIIRRLQRAFGLPETGDEPVSMELTDDKNPMLKLTIQSVGDEVKALIPDYRRSGLAIKITGISVRQHDQALRLIKKIADALFFQVDLLTNLSLRVVKTIKSINVPNRGVAKNAEPIAFPKCEYDDAPISLYWYARSAVGMPLLQYLAYYQVLEFYFPTYSQKEQGRRIQTILKDPRFRQDRDADISRLLAVIKNGGTGSFGGERDQLKATLSECLPDVGGLKEFLLADEDRKKIFSAKKLPLTSYKLSLPQGGSDLRTEIADIVYDIRCKIVHTKGDDGGSPETILLPFSPEAEQLRPYVEVMRYLAQSVLISASTELRLG